MGMNRTIRDAQADDRCYSELAREKMWARIHLIPLLQAEADRDLVRRHWAEQARERELMGTETKVYHSDRWAFHGPFPSLHLYSDGLTICADRMLHTDL